MCGSEGSRKDWAELYGCIKQVSNDQSLQRQSLENLSLSLCLRETENWNSSSKTVFYKDCSLGSVAGGGGGGGGTIYSHRP